MPAHEGDISLYESSRKVIEDRLCPFVNNAVVFLDDSSAEVIHWLGGASVLFDYGALDIREFSSFEVRLCRIALCNHTSNVNFIPNVLLFAGRA